MVMSSSKTLHTNRHTFNVSKMWDIAWTKLIVGKNWSYFFFEMKYAKIYW